MAPYLSPHSARVEPGLVGPQQFNLANPRLESPVQGDQAAQRVHCRIPARGVYREQSRGRQWPCPPVETPENGSKRALKGGLTGGYPAPSAEKPPVGLA